MGKRGPKPKPTQLKLERGNPGKRALNAEEPELAAAAIDAPKGLPKAARDEWDRLVGELTAKGILTVGDIQTFKQYCLLVAEVDACEKLSRKVGFANAVRLGYANQLTKKRGQLKQFAAEIGLTPASRSAVKAVRSGGGVSEAEQKRRRFFGTGDGKTANA